MGVEVPGVDERVAGRDVPDVVAHDGADGADRSHHEGEFDAFVAGSAGRLLGTAFLLTGDQRAAEDLLQETLLRVWSRWSRVRAAEHPLAYARRVLVNTSVSRWRATRTRIGGERLVAEPPETANASQPSRDDELWQAVLSLPPRQRAVMVLAYYEDLTDADTADVLGCTVGTVKSQRAKALRSLRAALAEEER
jgi:RNA polymerase sigma-70 factor (sigma-E family)